MPIYEYEPNDRDCLMCEGRIEILQGIDEEALKFCPHCGLDVCRVISRASIKVERQVSPEAAAKKGFSTYRRAGKGTWEKIAGPGEGKATGDGVLDVDKLEE